VLLLYTLLRLQPHLPLSQGHTGVPAPLAFNTAVSFTTNTSWQNYSGETTLGHLVQAAGLGTQAFVSAAVGMAGGVALIRGLTRSLHDGVGNFWVDLTRGVIRILLPLSLVFGLALVAFGVMQSPGTAHTVTTLAGHRQTIPDGLVGSWESIKLMSGDGGGLFNANSAHPLENPTALTNAIEVILMLLVPTAFIRTYGRLVGDRRQGWGLLIVVALLFGAALAVTSTAEHAHRGTALTAAGAASEGTETRFGMPASALFGTAATASANDAANSSYDSFTSLGGGALLATIMLGEVAPGGTGSGLYGLLIVSLLAVFIAGLMIERTPEYMRKRLEAREMKLISLYLLATPAVILTGTAVAVALPAGRAGVGNPGPHGLSEIAYAFTSSANGNGNAFAGLTANTTFYKTALAVTMVVGRYLPIVFVLAHAGSLVRQRARPVTVGTLPTHGPLFVTLVTTFVLIFTALDFVLVLALGPLAEGLRG
jgi:K+-transporting ATPase KdpA subunit